MSMENVTAGDNVSSHEDEYESLPSEASFPSHMIAGALAGISEHSVTYPFDMIKTRMQALESLPTSRLSAVFRQISSEGKLRFFRGVLSVVLGAGPAHALYFATYEKAKSTFVNESSSFRHVAAGFSGALATLVHDAFMNPFDVVKQRMQISSSQFRNIFDCARHLWKHEGVSAFYVSYATTLLLNVPFQAIQFPVYEASTRFLNPTGEYNPVVHMASGAIAGSAAAALTTPLDCVKTLLQTKGSSPDANIRSASGMADGIRILFKTRGLSGFFRGIQPRILAQMPATALCWTTYEYFKLALGLRSEPEKL